MPNPKDELVALPIGVQITLKAMRDDSDVKSGAVQYISLKWAEASGKTGELARDELSMGTDWWG